MKIEKSITMQDGTKVTVRIESESAEDFPILRTSTLESTARGLIKFADLFKPRPGSGEAATGEGQKIISRQIEDLAARVSNASMTEVLTKIRQWAENHLPDAQVPYDIATEALLAAKWAEVAIARSWDGKHDDRVDG